MLIFEDPPIHDIHRKLLARMFTPRKINALEPKIREFCVAEPRPAGRRRDGSTSSPTSARIMPMRAISALLGIPEEDQEAIRDHVNAQMRTEAGKPMKAAEEGLVGGDDLRGLHRLARRATRPTTS